MPPLPATPELQAAIDQAVQAALLHDQTERHGQAIESLTRAQNELNTTLQNVNHTLQDIKASVDGFAGTTKDVADLKAQVASHAELVGKLRRVQTLFYSGMGVAGLINPEVREFVTKLLTSLLGAP